MNLLTDLTRILKHRKRTAQEAIQAHNWWQEETRRIAPSKIQEYFDHIKINDTEYVQCLIVGVPSFESAGYPQKISPGLMNRLLEISIEDCTITYTTGIIPLSLMETSNLLKQAEFNNYTNTIAAKKDNTEGFVSAEHSLIHQDIVGRMQKIYDQNDKMCMLAMIVTVRSTSKDKLVDAVSQIRGVLSSELIDSEIPLYRMLETYLASLPFPSLPDFTMTDMFTSTASLLIPSRSLNSNTADTGLYFGDDWKTGKNVVVDFNILPAKHMMIVGPSGSGKTFSMLLLMMRAHDMLNKRVIYITPKSDAQTNYRAVAAYYKDRGCVIDIGRGLNNINPLQIFFDQSTMGSMDNGRAYADLYDRHKDLLGMFFQTWLGGSLTSNMEAYIDETLNMVYASKGIYRERPEAWRDADWPVLDDLRQIWEEDMKNASLGSRRATAEALFNKTYKVGKDGALSYMNRPTDIDLSADFIVIDLANVPDSIKDAMNVLVTGIMSMRFGTDNKKETIIAVDEGMVFLQTPSLGSFLMKTLTQGRSYGVNLWLSTQHVTDLIKANVAEEFKTNMHVKVVLGALQSDALKPVSEFFNLDKGWSRTLSELHIGEGLVVVDGEKTPVVFKPSKHEYDIIKNTQNTISKRFECVLSVRDEVSELAGENGFYLEDWLEDSYRMTDLGFTAHVVQRAIGRGTARAWIEEKRISEDGKIGNQSIDHYATVMQIAGYLALLGWSVTVNHYDGVDVVAERDGESVGFEYERPGSHGQAELVRKRENAENTVGRCFFVVTGENEDFVKRAVGREVVVRRGTQLEGLIKGL